MIRINLIPHRVQVAALRRRRVRGWIVAAAVAGALVCAPLGMDHLRQAEATRLQSQHAQLQTQVGALRMELRAVGAEANHARLQLERAKALRAKRPWSSIFELLARTMPLPCWLTSVATDPPAPAHGAPRRHAGAQTPVRQISHGGVDGLTGHETLVMDAPRRLRIAGYSTDAGQPHAFVARLKNTGVFSEVILERSLREPSDSDVLFQFEVVCEW